MSVLDVTYSYKILSADIDLSTVLIEYKPDDEDCMPVTLNCNILLADPASFEGAGYTNQEDVPFSEHMKYTAVLQAPLARFRAQKWAVLNNVALDNQIAANTYVSISA